MLSGHKDWRSCSEIFWDACGITGAATFLGVEGSAKLTGVNCTCEALLWQLSIGVLLDVLADE